MAEPKEQPEITSGLTRSSAFARFVEKENESKAPLKLITRIELAETLARLAVMDLEELAHSVNKLEKLLTDHVIKHVERTEADQENIDGQEDQA